MLMGYCGLLFHWPVSYKAVTYFCEDNVEERTNIFRVSPIYFHYWTNMNKSYFLLLWFPHYDFLENLGPEK